MKLVGKPCNSVMDMVRDTSDDPKFVAAMEKRLAEREFVRKLIVMRGLRDFTQQDLATRMGCTQSAISKLEASRDCDLKFGEVWDYLGALDRNLRIIVTPKGAGITDHIRFHCWALGRELKRLTALVGDDPAIAKGVTSFIVNAVGSLISRVNEALALLPKRDETPESHVTVDVECDTAEGAEPGSMAKGGRELVPC